MIQPGFNLKIAAECVAIYGERAMQAALADDREAVITEILNAIHAAHCALTSARNPEIPNHE